MPTIYICNCLVLQKMGHDRNKNELQEQLQYKSFIRMFFKMSKFLLVYDFIAVLIVN